MSDFDYTPSFFNSQAAFQKFLANTSFYIALQNAVSKLISLCNPKSVLELGSGTGATSCRYAKENPNLIFTAVDLRDKMTMEGINLANSYDLINISFLTCEMVDYIRTIDHLPDFTFLLYSFHHVSDPSENKVEFLKLCKQKMKKGSMLCIAEAFLPESYNLIELNSLLNRVWSYRCIEAYSSVFWNALDSLSSESIQNARNIADYSSEQESRAGQLVVNRDNEYLVSAKWLDETAQSLGFIKIIGETINSVNDYVFLFEKA